jgi:hypothetical protein
MLRFLKAHPWFSLFAIIWALVCVYLFALILFLRVEYADGLYWYDTIPPRAIPAWYYIPQHILLYAPLLIAAALPFVLKYYATKGRIAMK